MANNESTILGIDPGTNVMGYGILKIEEKKPVLIALGIIDLRQIIDPYQKLGKIHEKISKIIAEYLPSEVAIEAPFFGKNVQSMLKLGRAQGVAIAAAIPYKIPICEYAPLKIKMAITGQGQASKEQVARMLQRLLKINESDMPKYMDATDALGVAYCHFLQKNAPLTTHTYGSWKDFIRKNKYRINNMSILK